MTLKLLIAGDKKKFFHLREFSSALERFGMSCKLVCDADIYDGIPSKNFTHWFQTRSKFNQLISDFKPDAILVDSLRYFTLAATETKIPVFILLRGNYWVEKQWAKEKSGGSPIKRLFDWQLIRIAQKSLDNSTVILPVCKYLEDVVKEHYPDKKTGVVYTGIDPSKWYPSEGIKLKHPCVGLLQDASILGKTIEMLTLTKVLEAMPHVTFYWVGDGIYRDNVLPILSKYDNFKWLGTMQYPDKVREFLTEIDVYALVSGIDMSPMTLQESQLMEKPVVATNVGGVSELMEDNKTGFLVEKGNHDSLIEKISILINDSKKAKQMGASGRSFVIKNFSWENIAKEFIIILNSTINKLEIPE